MQCADLSQALPVHLSGPSACLCRLNSVKQTSMPGSTPVQLLMAMLGGQGMGNCMPAMLPSDSVNQGLQGPTQMPGQQPSGRG